VLIAMAGKKIKLDVEAISEILVADTAFFPPKKAQICVFFSQKGANMRKQLFSRYNIGSIMSAIFQERLRGHAGYPFETLRKHSYSLSLTTISKFRALYHVICNQKSQYFRITVYNSCTCRILNLYNGTENVCCCFCF